jgi:general secretion pathway protein J
MNASATRAVSEAGFTLVELLVALALFSLLTTALFESVRSGLQAWQRGNARAEHVQHGLIAQDVLRRMIGNIYPMLVTVDATRKRIDFEGAKDSISFLAPAPMAASAGRRFRFKLLVEQRGDRNDLIMSAVPELEGVQAASMPAKTLLVADVASATFSYFGEPAAGRSAQWSDSWAQRIDMPQLIRVDVAFRGGDGRSWPDFVIAPRITADVSCVYDPGTTRCRGR